MNKGLRLSGEDGNKANSNPIYPELVERNKPNPLFALENIPGCNSRTIVYNYWATNILQGLEKILKIVEI